MIASSGINPVVRYRQSATINLRASATMAKEACDRAGR
jgi:hypothetical protein